MTPELIKQKLSTIMQDVSCKQKDGYWLINAKFSYQECQLSAKDKLKLSKELTKSGFVYLQNKGVMTYRQPSLAKAERFIDRMGL